MSFVFRFATLACTFAPSIPAWGHASVLSHTHATTASAAVGFGGAGMVAMFVVAAALLTLLWGVCRNCRNNWSVKEYLHLRGKQ
ncbi:MAG: hypothetical protein ACR2PG_14700 [Hyphomicrobiaceae bacterium]